MTPSSLSSRFFTIVVVYVVARVPSTTAQDCALTFYFTGSQQDRVVFTGLTAEEKAASGNNTSGHRLTCACTNVEGLTPLQWLDVNGMVLPEDRSRSLIDYRVAGNQPGSAVHLRINKAGFSCAEADNYTCVVGTNTRSVLVTPIGEDCLLLPPTSPIFMTTSESFSFSKAATITVVDASSTTSAPVVVPSTQVVTSTTPVVAPSTPVVTSTTPVVAPSTPVVTSTTPVVAPSTQVVTSTTPVTVSTSPAVTPSSTFIPASSSVQPSISPTPSPSVDLQPPTGVSVSVPSASDGAVNITLMWSRPELDSGLTGYRVQYSWESRWDPSQFVKRQSERKTMSVHVDDTATSYTLQDAEGFAEYCFEVSALYEGGMESPAATEMCTDTPETKPTPPQNLRQVGSSVTTSSVRLQWAAPDPPNGNIMFFKVYYQPRGAPRQYQVSDWYRQGYVILDGLDPNTEYYINVTAVTGTSESDASNGLRVVTLSGAALPDVGMSSDSGELIGTVVASLMLLVLTNAVSVVTTFLCTRRCYRKKKSSSPPSPDEKCVYYEAVELDSVQMQSSPAYASVDEAKCN